MDNLPLARRDVISARLAAGQPAVAAALAAEFGVSEDAIRRDLRALTAEGLCRRVYGGALPLSLVSAPMSERLNHAQDRKDHLARAGAALVGENELVFLDSGSTNLAVVKYLPADYGLTVATNSIAIAAEVLKRTDLRLIMLGGVVDAHVGGCIDAGAVLAVGQLNIDRCFIGACAVSAELGVCAFDPSDATFKRAALAASLHRIALATTDKLATRAPYRVAAVKDVNRFVLESDAPASVVDALQMAGASVITAAPGS